MGCACNADGVEWGESECTLKKQWDWAWGSNCRHKSSRTGGRQMVGSLCDVIVCLPLQESRPSADFAKAREGWAFSDFRSFQLSPARKLAHELGWYWFTLG